MKNWQFGNRESIRIFGFGNHVVAIVIGKKGRHCRGPRLILLPSGRWALRCSCAEDCAREAGGDDYFIVQPLSGQSMDGPISVLHRQGCDEIAAEVLSPAKSVPVSQAILGISQDFSLEAAFKDALAKLGPEPDRSPSLVEVVSMGALYGGFSGFSRLFVRVEKTESRGMFSGTEEARSSS